MSKCIWLSVNPILKKVDVYPKNIAIRIEKKYKEKGLFTFESCVLGEDYFNATVHLHDSGYFYQTTPGINIGRTFKKPGFRSVKRININSEDEYFTIYAKLHGSEWRICDKTHAQYTFHEKIDPETLIDTELIDEAPTLEYKEWESTYIENEDSKELENYYVVCWQWCIGTPENLGNLMILEDKWWKPYLYPQNKIIEWAFRNKLRHVDITLPFDESIKRIKFAEASCFASQEDELYSKSRVIRRKIITVKELQNLIKKINDIPKTSSEILESLEDDIPKEFICCITQNVMSFPVKTADGHTYENYAIMKWFEEHDTSPLTGLPLTSKVLINNDELKMKIDNYIELHGNQ